MGFNQETVVQFIKEKLNFPFSFYFCLQFGDVCALKILPETCCFLSYRYGIFLHISSYFFGYCELNVMFASYSKVRLSPCSTGQRQ